MESWIQFWLIDNNYYSGTHVYKCLQSEQFFYNWYETKNDVIHEHRSKCCLVMLWRHGSKQIPTNH